MKKLIFLTILAFVYLSCTQEQLGEIIEIYPPPPATLRLVNQLENNLTITSWRMSGYEFNDLEIRPGDSRPFELVNGMPEGYKGLTITVIISSSTQSFLTTHRIDFESGKISTLLISECPICN